MSDQAGTWTIDWSELGAVLNPSLYYAICDAQAVIADYRRQQAAAGVMEVRWEHLAAIRTDIAHLADWVMLNEAPDIADELRSWIRALDRILAATKDQD